MKIQGHAFQWAQASWSTTPKKILNFRRQDTPTHFGQVVWEDRQHICHVQSTGNDYALVESPPDSAMFLEHSAFDLPDGGKVLLASVHGTGEVRWLVTPQDVKHFLETGMSGAFSREDMEELTRFFGLTKRFDVVYEIAISVLASSEEEAVELAATKGKANAGELFTSENVTSVSPYPAIGFVHAGTGKTAPAGQIDPQLMMDQDHT
jgi:hypothetical protein